MYTHLFVARYSYEGCEYVPLVQVKPPVTTVVLAMFNVSIHIGGGCMQGGWGRQGNVSHLEIIMTARAPHHVATLFVTMLKLSTQQGLRHSSKSFVSTAKNEEDMRSKVRLDLSSAWCSRACQNIVLTGGTSTILTPQMVE